MTNSGWLGRTFKEIKEYCDLRSSLDVRFTEDYKEHKCLVEDNELFKWLEEVEKD